MTEHLQNIVLADDDPDDRLLFQQAISTSKIKTALQLFNNGKELMDHLLKVDTGIPDVIFLDLNMPIKNGLECLNEIRSTEKLQGVTIAIYSTSSSEEDIANTFIMGANIYINKPETFPLLKSAIEKVLTMDWQYYTSNLNKDNFLLRI